MSKLNPKPKPQTQTINSATLINPWALNKNSYDQRWDTEWFDDDDPRE
jgi:hypothetical protein